MRIQYIFDQNVSPVLERSRLFIFLPVNSSIINAIGNYILIANKKPPTIIGSKSIIDFINKN